MEFPEDEKVTWNKILRKILITCVRSNANEVENVVIEICAAKLEKVDRGQCNDLLQFAYKLQEAMRRIEWAIKIFKPERMQEEMMNMHGRNAMKYFTNSLTQFEKATWTAVRMTNIPLKDRIQEVIHFIQEKEEANVPSSAISQQAEAFPIRKRPSEKIIKRTNVEGKYSEKTEETEPTYEEEPREEPKSKKSKPKPSEDDDDDVG